MEYYINESWLDKEDDLNNEERIKEYLKEYEKFLLQLPEGRQRKECISGINRIKRLSLWSSDGLNIKVNIGDLCYLDYGLAFINEAGYQHFGLVIGVFNYKVLVIPMTSNQNVIAQARNLGGVGKHHLFYIGKIKGLNKPSVLFLNDLKYVNSARIISVNGHIPPSSEMFKDICQYLHQDVLP